VNFGCGSHGESSEGFKKGVKKGVIFGWSVVCWEK